MVLFVLEMASIVTAVVGANVAIGLLFSGGARRDERSLSECARSLAVSMSVLWTIAVIGGQLTNYSSTVLVASAVAFAIVVTNTASMIRLSRSVREKFRDATKDSPPLRVRIRTR
jgi:hypothetical protein